MHKKLEAELTSLAHSILQMKNKEDVFALQKKAHEVYERLSVLAYVEEYINNTPNPSHTKEELIALVEEAEEKQHQEIDEIVEDAVEIVNQEEVIEEELIEEEPKVDTKPIQSEVIDEVIENTIQEVKEELDVSDSAEVIKHDLEESIEIEEEIIEEEVPEIIDEVETPVEVIEEEVDEVLELVEEVSKEETEDLFTIEEKKTPSLEEELQDTISVDIVADLFENAPKKSLNDKLQGDIQIGLNDRIAFVKHLFGGSQEDFNRVISQLNTFKTQKEARKFINKMVKPDYDWSEKEEFEERFMNIVERKFV